MASHGLIIAHRGGSGLGPENTLAAARASLRAGADLWELDIEVSKDGVLVLAHDDSLVRTSNVKAIFPDREPWLLKDFTYAELRRLDFGSWFTPEPGDGGTGPGSGSRSFVGEPVVTLHEALRFTLASDWRVIVELKDLKGGPGESTAVESAVALILELRMVDRVLLSSFRPDYLRRAREASPDLRLGALVFEPLPEPEKLLEELGAQVYMPPARAADPGQVGRLQELGLEEYVWTVNEEAMMRRCLEIGVGGIITDYPHRVRAIRDEPGRSESLDDLSGMH